MTVDDRSQQINVYKFDCFSEESMKFRTKFWQLIL